MNNNECPDLLIAGKVKLASSLAFLFALILFGTLTASAQSTDPQSPTPLTAGEIAGAEIAERTSYYFSFAGGPGEVTAALTAKMKKDTKGTSIGVEIFDANAKSLASALVSGGLDAGKEKLEQALFNQLGKLTSAAESLGGSDTKQKTARVKVKANQPLILKLTVDQGIESFTVLVGGAVEFNQGAATPTGEETPSGETPATDQTPPADDSVPTTDPATETGEPTQPSEPGAQTGSKPPAIKIPGKKTQPATETGQKPPAVKIPGKQTPTQSQKPPLVIMPKPKPAQSNAQPMVKKPAVILIPKKKQP